MPQSKPWEKYAPSGGQSASGGGIVYPDPYRPRAESRADTSAAMDVRRADLQATNTEREVNRTRLQNPLDLRDNYNRFPEVQNYRIVLQQANRATRTDANPQGDLALTYAFAQAMDPKGSVREGDQQSVASSQPAFQAFVENVKKQFGMDGAGSYAPQARAALRQQIFSQVASLKPLYDARRADMADNARAVGVDPKEVIGRDDTTTYAPMFRTYGEKNGDPEGVISGLIGGEPIKGAGLVVPHADPFTPAGAGATTTSQPIPKEMQQEQSAYLASHWGKVDPADYAAFRASLDYKYGFTPDPSAYRAEAPKFNDYAAKGGAFDKLNAIPAPERPMSALEQVRNNAVASPLGTSLATAANAIGFGIPGLFAGDQLNALHTLNPKSAMAGDIAGGIIGAASAGGGLKAGANLLERGAGLEGAGALERVGAPAISDALRAPVAGDMAYSGVYGANTAGGRGENPLIGGTVGALAGLGGNRLGNALGKAFPGATGIGGKIGELDASVPTSQDLKTTASGLYQSAENRGLTATPDETFALADSTKKILADAGRITPKDALADTNARTNAAYKLIGDYAGEPMAPTQIQTTRGVISDGLSSPEAGDRRISRLLLNNFDNWTDATNPDLAAGLSDARSVASRYLQGDKIAEARNLADVRAGQFSNSGPGNALRTDFRALDRGIAKGTEQFPDNVASAIGDVARGTPVSNALRFVGRFAPTGPLSAVPTMTAMATGNAAAGPLGAVGGATLGGLAYGARQLGQRMTQRAAQVAENSAYGGPEYSDALTALLNRSGDRGARAATGIFGTQAAPRATSLIQDILLRLQGNTLAPTTASAGP